MNTKSKYLQSFIDVSKKYLHHQEATEEYNYLLSRISNDKIEQFQFGYFPKDNAISSKLIEEVGALLKEDPIPALKECGVIYVTEKYNKVVPFFKQHHLLIPFFDVYGNPISIVGRSILSSEQMKELNPIIRNAIYTALYASTNPDKASQEFVLFQSMLIPSYWEEPKLTEEFKKLQNNFK